MKFHFGIRRTCSAFVFVILFFAEAFASEATLASGSESFLRDVLESVQKAVSQKDTIEAEDLISQNIYEANVSFLVPTELVGQLNEVELSNLEEQLLNALPKQICREIFAREIVDFKIVSELSHPGSLPNTMKVPARFFNSKGNSRSIVFLVVFHRERFFVADILAKSGSSFLRTQRNRYSRAIASFTGAKSKLEGLQIAVSKTVK